MTTCPPLRLFVALGSLVAACATTPASVEPAGAVQATGTTPRTAPSAEPPPAAQPPMPAPQQAAEPPLVAQPPAPAAHWGYQGEVGPAHWSDESPAYQECKLGKRQSPIDIRGAVKANLPPLEFSYQPAPLRIIDNGHTIQVSVPAGSSLSVGGKRYELLQFHFHHPSETKLDGQAFPLEGHLVHKDADGRLAVVAILFTQGKANPFLASLWKNLPQQVGTESAPEGVTVDPGRLLPSKRAYFTFPGSLTTPPCSEDVTWFVLRNELSLSGSEVAAFAARYPLNARPVQPLNGRPLQTTK